MFLQRKKRSIFSASSCITRMAGIVMQCNEGSVTGVHVRGGAVVEMSWKDGKLQTLALTSKADGAVQIIAPAGQSIAAIRAPSGHVLTLKQGEPFHIQNGVTYQLRFR
jgi:hypothetical protein